MSTFFFLLIAYIVPAFGESQTIEIDDIYFLSALVETGVDQNHDGQIQVVEALAVDSLLLEKRKINSIVGINEFKNLEYLSVHHNNIKEIRISGLTKLTDLLCYNSNIEQLHLQCPQLLTIKAHQNLLQNISIGLLPRLQALDIDESVMVLDPPQTEPGQMPQDQDKCYGLAEWNTTITKYHVNNRGNKWIKHTPRPKKENIVTKRWTRIVCEDQYTPRLHNLLTEVMDTVKFEKPYYGGSTIQNDFKRYQWDHNLPHGQLDLNTMIHLGLLESGEEDVFLSRFEFKYPKEEAKMRFDLEAIDSSGVVHLAKGKKANKYRFLMPNEEVYKQHVMTIDTGIIILPDSLQAVMIEHGRQKLDQIYCFGSTMRSDIKSILLQLAAIEETESFNVFYSEPVETEEHQKK